MCSGFHLTRSNIYVNELGRIYQRIFFFFVIAATYNSSYSSLSEWLKYTRGALSIQYTSQNSWKKDTLCISCPFNFISLSSHAQANRGTLYYGHLDIRKWGNAFSFSDCNLLDSTILLVWGWELIAEYCMVHINLTYLLHVFYALSGHFYFIQIFISLSSESIRIEK